MGPNRAAALVQGACGRKFAPPGRTDTLCDEMTVLRRLFARPGLLIVLTATVAWFAIEVVDDDGLRQLVKLQDSVEETELSNAALRGDVDRLRRRVNALKSEPTALERAAREQGYVRDDELLFILE